LELGSHGAQSGAVTGADPLGSDSGNRLHQDSSVAVDFQFLALNISLLNRASVWRMTDVLELLKRLNYVAVCHVPCTSRLTGCMQATLMK